MPTLSLNTNEASLFTQSQMALAHRNLATSMTRMGTGYRVNSAMDDASGLQIAKRMDADISGTRVALKNAQNGISLVQVTEGSLDELSKILLRTIELSEEAASTGSASAEDAKALQAEFDQLGAEIANILKNTRYGGDNLFDETAGKLTKSFTFQIGATKQEKMDVDVSAALKDIYTAARKLSKATANVLDSKTDPTDELTGTAPADALQNSRDLLNTVTGMRAKLGATAKRLEHVHNNQSNILNFTQVARGRIMDTDYALESANLSARQMSLQAGAMMLKSSTSLNQMALTLMQ